MAEECFFCSVAQKKVKVMDVFEDDYFFAFLDINPASLGHTLVIPKRHCTVIGQLNEEELKDLFVVIKKIENGIMQEFKPKGFQINIPNGAAAGQKAPHLLIHIIPNYDEPKIKFKIGNFDKAKTNQIATILKSELGK